MKVLFFSGSPRKNGNTAAIIEQVAEKVREHHIVEICYIADYQINGCKGCNVCQRNLVATGCIQKDMAAMLLDKIIDADVVVYGTPLYGHSYSGQLKIFMDRHVALFKFVGGSENSVDEMEILSFIKDKPTALIVSCQGPMENNTELIQMQFKKFCESSLSHCFGTYIFPWCSPDVVCSHFSADIINRIVCDIEECGCH